MTQLALTFARSSKPKQARGVKLTIEQRFAEFDGSNPHVYARLQRLAFDRLKRGDRRIGVKALWEELRRTLARAELAEQTGYKLNNDFTALYARKLIDNHPELVTVIEVRRRRGEP